MAREERSPEEQRMIDEWLKKNEVTICPPNTRTDTIEYVYGWGKKKKKAPPKKVDS